jgi:predicted RNA-binding Zn ribbon-like protein
MSVTRCHVAERGVDMTNRTNTPVLCLALANTAKPSRPSGARVTRSDDLLGSRESAAAFLATAGLPGLGAGHRQALQELRELRDAMEAILHGLAHAATGEDGLPPAAADDLEVLNAVAGRCCLVVRLDASLASRFVPAEDDPVAGIATLCVMELNACDPSRFKTCERHECGRYFYDTTRNRSGRWHAEEPCGWRMRAQRRTRPVAATRG